MLSLYARLLLAVIPLPLIVGDELTLLNTRFQERLHKWRASNRFPEEGADRRVDPDDPGVPDQPGQGHRRHCPGIHAAAASQLHRQEINCWLR